MITELYNAAPYIEQFQDTIFVVKVGGEVLQNPRQLESLTRQVLVLWQIGVHPVVVHGAGPQLDQALADAGVKVEKVEGRRITDEQVLNHATKVFRGSANLSMVNALVQQGVPAVGLSGVDGGTLTLRKRPPVEMGGREVDFGLVGDPVSVNPDLILSLIDAQYVPTVCSLGADVDGQVLNVNADTMACELAVGLDAEKLMFITDKPGILHDAGDHSSIYSTLDEGEIEELVKKGIIAGGMAPKVSAGLSALRRGVGRVHVLGVDEKDALLEETFTNQGCGTMLVLAREGGEA